MALINIIKRDGRKELYESDKLLAGLLKCCDYSTANKVVGTVENRIFNSGNPEITAGELHDITTEALRVESLSASLRYGLRQSLMKLGPAGFAFEDFIADMLRLEGKAAVVRVKEQGRCALHELDIVYEENGSKIFIECKYHTEYGVYTGLKEAMYTYMRLLDLRDKGLKYENCTLITNTKVSWEAVDFAACKHIDVMAWKFPRGRGLEKTLERLNMYPVTVLDFKLSRERLAYLLSEHIVTLRDLIKAYENGRIDQSFKEVVDISRQAVAINPN